MKPISHGLLSILFFLFLGCQSVPHSGYIYYVDCGRELAETDQEGVFRCALGHEEKIYVKEGTKPRLTCRHQVETNVPPVEYRKRGQRRDSGVAWDSILFAGIVLGSVAAVTAAANADGGAGAGADEMNQTVPPKQTESTTLSKKMMIFGGKNNKVYLGCLNCDEFKKDSVFNTLGLYGSSYYQESIWNTVGPYGSSYSQYSACNRYAQHPPIIVDQDGNAYGRFTLNRSHRYANTDPLLTRLIEETICGD